MQFFRQIAEATRNEVLTILVDSLGDIVRYVTDKVGRKSRPELFAVRRRILKAIRARDVIAATRAMNEYLANVHDVMDDEPIALRRPGREPAPPAVARTAAAKPRAKAKPKMRIAEKAAGKSVAKPRPRPRTA
jgi:2,3-bisphosphoglycerate-independent phosphoglycerate mutase